MLGYLRRIEASRSNAFKCRGQAAVPPASSFTFVHKPVDQHVTDLDHLKTPGYRYGTVHRASTRWPREGPS